MNNEISKVIVASDIKGRDGIGVEIYIKDNCTVEIFRDDVNKKRTITLYKNEISMELMEKCIEIFKKEIPWDFSECKNNG